MKRVRMCACIIQCAFSLWKKTRSGLASSYLENSTITTNSSVKRLFHWPLGMSLLLEMWPLSSIQKNLAWKGLSKWVLIWCRVCIHAMTSTRTIQSTTGLRGSSTGVRKTRSWSILRERSLKNHPMNSWSWSCHPSSWLGWPSWSPFSNRGVSISSRRYPCLWSVWSFRYKDFSRIVKNIKKIRKSAWSSTISISRTRPRTWNSSLGSNEKACFTISQPSKTWPRWSNAMTRGSTKKHRFILTFWPIVWDWARFQPAMSSNMVRKNAVGRKMPWKKKAMPFSKLIRRSTIFQL